MKFLNKIIIKKKFLTIFMSKKLGFLVYFSGIFNAISDVLLLHKYFIILLYKKNKSQIYISFSKNALLLNYYYCYFIY